MEKDLCPRVVAEEVLQGAKMPLKLGSSMWKVEEGLDARKEPARWHLVLAQKA
jgi:hypothetical protein